MPFIDIPDRANALRIDREWFDALRDAGILLEAALAASIVSFQAIANNQAVAANVTALLFDSAAVKLAVVDYTVRRKSDSVDVVGGGTFFVHYRPATSDWELTSGPAFGEDHGVAFTVTAGGQVQYTSDSRAGVYNTGLSKMNFNARVVEV
jgi:hypothetical protein